MSKFSGRIFTFLIFPIGVILIDLIPPPNAFTFRQWEALQFNYPYFSHSSFYPGQTITMTEVGDLGRHTSYQIEKLTTWQTDKLGFRNNVYIPNPDVLLIGDSFFAGSSLTQDSTIGNTLQRKLDSINIPDIDKVYNISPVSFEKFDFFLKSQLLGKPRIIIFSMVERSIRSLKKYTYPEKLSVKERILNEVIKIIPYQIPMYFDRLVKFNFLRFVSVKINPIELINYFKKTATKDVDVDRYEPKMLFLRNLETGNSFSDTVSTETVETLVSCQSYCDKMGIKLIFLPIPDKETVYYERTTQMNAQPSYLLKLDSAMQKNNIISLNTLNIYNAAKRFEPGKKLYLYDDTHWSPYGVNILANELLKEIIYVSHKNN